MAPPKNSWKDWVWLGWFAMQVPVILSTQTQELTGVTATAGVDMVDKYPGFLIAEPGAPLHFLHRFRAWYIATYNDPLMQWAPEGAGDGGHSWIPLFFWLELLFLLPVTLYGIRELGVRRRGTRGQTELLFVVYALEVAFTTLVVINDVSYWDPEVYSDEQKNVFRFQLYGPYFVLPVIMAADMYSRLLQRFGAADAVKKTQ